MRNLFLILSLFLCSTTAIYATVAEVNDENIEQEVGQSKQLVVVMVYTNWCPYCKQMKPVFEQLSKENPDVKFVKIDDDASDKVDAPGVPAFLFIRNKEILDIVNGAAPKEVLQKAIDKARGPRT